MNVLKYKILGDTLEKYRVSEKLNVFVFRNLIKKDDCKFMCDYIDKKSKKNIKKYNNINKIRIQEIEKNEYIQKKLLDNKEIQDLLNIFKNIKIQNTKTKNKLNYNGIDNNITFSKHCKGQEISYHIDVIKNPKQVFKVGIVCSECEGGSTIFVPIGYNKGINDIKIETNLGDVIIFMIDRHIHKGGPIISGTKYMIGMRILYI